MITVYKPLEGVTYHVRPLLRWTLATALHRMSALVQKHKRDMPLLSGRMRFLRQVMALYNSGKTNDLASATQAMVRVYTSIAQALEIMKLADMQRVSKDVFESNATSRGLLEHFGVQDAISKGHISRDEVFETIIFAHPQAAPDESQRDVIQLAMTLLEGKGLVGKATDQTTYDPYGTAPLGPEGAVGIAFFARMLELVSSELKAGPGSVRAGEVPKQELTGRAQYLRSVAGNYAAASHAAALDVRDQLLVFLKSPWAQNAAIGDSAEKVIRLLDLVQFRTVSRTGFSEWNWPGDTWDFDVLKTWLSTLSGEAELTKPPTMTKKGNPLYAEVKFGTGGGPIRITPPAISQIAELASRINEIAEQAAVDFENVIGSAEGAVTTFPSEPTVLPDTYWNDDVAMVNPQPDFTYPSLGDAPRRGILWSEYSEALADFGASMWSYTTFANVRKHVLEHRPKGSEDTRPLLVPIHVPGQKATMKELTFRTLLPATDPFYLGGAFNFMKNEDEPNYQTLRHALGLQKRDWQSFVQNLPLDADSLILRAVAEAFRFVGVLYVVNSNPEPVYPYGRHWYHGKPEGDKSACLGPRLPLLTEKERKKGEDVKRLEFAPFTAIPHTCDITRMRNGLQLIKRDLERKDRPIAVWLSTEIPRPTTPIWGWVTDEVRPVHDIVGLPAAVSDMRSFERITGLTENAPYWTSRNNFVFALDDKPTPMITVPGDVIMPTDPW